MKHLIWRARVVLYMLRYGIIKKRFRSVAYAWDETLSGRIAVGWELGDHPHDVVLEWL